MTQGCTGYPKFLASSRNYHLGVSNGSLDIQTVLLCSVLDVASADSTKYPLSRQISHELTGTTNEYGRSDFSWTLHKAFLYLLSVYCTEFARKTSPLKATVKVFAVTGKNPDRLLYVSS